MRYIKHVNCIISINKKYYREIDTPGMTGDSSQLKRVVGWTPNISIEKTIENMIDKDINRLNKNKNV